MSPADLQAALECAWPGKTGTWDIEPAYRAASIGQVHRATLPNGQQIAIKIQYPDLQKNISRDVNNLNLFMRPFGNLKRGFKYDEYQQVVKDSLDRELNYDQELSTQLQFFRNWHGQHEIIIPRPLTSFCNHQVLTASWEPGDELAATVDSWKIDEQQQVAQLMLQFFFKGIFVDGLMQADWHPGNFRFRRNISEAECGVQLVCYDFGNVCQLEPAEQQTLLQLVQASIAGQEPFEYLVNLGFDPDYLEPIQDKLGPVCEILLAPFRHQGQFDLATWRMNDQVAGILQEDRWNLRVAGPPRLIFLMRAFHGLIKYLQCWHAKLDWRATLESVTGHIPGLGIIHCD